MLVLKNYQYSVSTFDNAYNCICQHLVQDNVYWHISDKIMDKKVLVLVDLFLCIDECLNKSIN